MRDNLISGLPLFKRGKVRDIYDLGDRLLMVASDRISCFDVVLPTEIPGKGKILTALVRPGRSIGNPAVYAASRCRKVWLRHRV